MGHWQASKKWVDVNYLLKVAGSRTVPIELGSQYSDENWSQKLMLLKDFIKDYYLQDSGEKGYLAQHNLFDQVNNLSIIFNILYKAIIILLLLLNYFKL